MQILRNVLKEAQEKGYAERNPEADVEGYDACRKIAILSSLAFGAMWIMRTSIQRESLRSQWRM